MTHFELKEALASRKPFTVRTTDGMVVPVPHQELAWLPPNFESLFVSLPAGGLKWIDIAHITSLEFEDTPLPKSTDNDV